MPHSALPRCATTTPLWLSALQAQFCTQPMRNSVHLSHSCFPSTFLTLTPALLALFVPLLHVSLRHTITFVRHGARLAAADARRFRYLPHRTCVLILQLSDLEILMPCGLLSKDRMASYMAVVRLLAALSKQRVTQIFIPLSKVERVLPRSRIPPSHCSHHTGLKVFDLIAR